MVELDGLDEIGVRRLVSAAQAGCPEAVDALFRMYDGTLRRIAWRYRGVSFEDALQEARLGLLICIRAYDATRGVDFGAYVWRKVRGDVRSRMRRLWTVAARNVYADAPVDGDESGTGSRWDTVAAGAGSGVAFDAADVELELTSLLDDAKLSPRERFAIEAGLMGYSLAELAQSEGVSVETVKTWRKRAFAKLRRCSR